VGGGIIGLASAWRLAQQGAKVTVFDPEPGGGASTVAAGMLSPVTEASMGEEHLLALGLASLERWPDFAAELTSVAGQPLGFRSDGTVMVAFDGDDRAALADLVERQQQMGLTTEALTGRELRREEPALAPAVRRGIRAADERSVDPVAVVSALFGALEQVGVTLVPRKVAEVVTAASRERVDGVRLDDGTMVTAPTVVVAAGPWSPQIAPFGWSSPGGSGGPAASGALPVRPVKGQVLTLRRRSDDVLVHHTVRGFVRGSVVYLVPRDDGRLVCGATQEERGWDSVPTAGGGYELLRDVLTLYPGLDEAELVGLKVGFRPGTPDHLPVLGRGPLDGLVLATGHYRNGILLAPVTAEAVVAFVTGTAPPSEVVPCTPDRFADSGRQAHTPGGLGGGGGVGRAGARPRPPPRPATRGGGRGGRGAGAAGGGPGAAAGPAPPPPNRGAPAGFEGCGS
jgi:glycine oxidase